MPRVLLLGRRQIAALMAPADYLGAVAQGFAALHGGRAHAPAPLHVATEAGSFHAKAAALQEATSRVALKFNANMPGNPARHWRNAPRWATWVELDGD